MRRIIFITVSAIILLLLQTRLSFPQEIVPANNYFCTYDEEKGLIKIKKPDRECKPICKNSFIEILRIKELEEWKKRIKELGIKKIANVELKIVYRTLKEFSYDNNTRICIDYFDKDGNPEGGQYILIPKAKNISYKKGQIDSVKLSIPENIFSWRIWLPEE